MKNHIPGKLEKSLAGFKFPTEINNEHPIIYRMDWHNVSDPSYYLALYKDGQVAGGVYLNQPGGEKASAITENGIISPNQWYAIKLIWSSGNKLKIYVNNDLKATSKENPIGNIRSGDDPLRIGCGYQGRYGWFYFQGILDEISISK